MDRRTFNRGVAMTIGLAALPIRGIEERTWIEEGFEGDIPDFHTFQGSYAADPAQAHGGRRSLRVEVEPGKPTGGAYFRLGEMIRPGVDYEFSAWVLVAPGTTARLFVSASDGIARHAKGQDSGGRAGEWVRLAGVVRGGESREADREFMLGMGSSGVCWFDDVTLRETRLPPPPIASYPVVLKSLQGVADRRVSLLSPGGTLVLDGRSGALATGFVPEEAQAPGQPSVALPPDGMLVFAIDAPRSMKVAGSLLLEPDGDLRPGVRATVLCDTTVIAAPMVAADPWQGEGNALTGPAPQCVGPRPPDRVELLPWLLPEGRHYLFVTAPHFRNGGTFRRIDLHASEEPVRAPLQQFALLSDTHFGSGRSTWMNVKMNEPSRAELASCLGALRAEGMEYALIAGDMTDGATRDQFAALGTVCREAGLPVYGCIGNHDAYHASSRADALELCAGLFPDGRTDYAFRRGNLRFVVLDGSYWRAADGSVMDRYEQGQSKTIGTKPRQVDWLRETLAADRVTPTIFVWHYPMVSREGLSSCGYRLPRWSSGPEVLAVLEEAPNVKAVLCGHTHWNDASTTPAGRLHLVNPAFSEWPNAYRVFRVYDDHLEWELRQVCNRGFVRESFAVPKALSWMISTAAGDLGGGFSL
ncbi:MAG: metallophosphoesterase [Lentisphaeria bacterium]|jgi:predicted phosphodiesterase|nr:metallophosphoesterase [Lentisphaeria bacterium]